MFRVLSPQERAGSRLRVLSIALVGALALGAPAFGQDHVHDLSATVLPHNIPDFCAVPGVVSTAQSGDWMNPTTWSNGVVPGPNDVRIIAPGHNVTIASTDPAVRVLCVEGSLAFATNANTKLTVGTMLVKPTGSLEMGSASAPVSAANTAEIVIANTPLNDPLMSGYDATRFDGNWVADPEQYGTGIISLGRTTFRGAAKSPTWARVTVEPRAGNRTLTLESPVTGWRAGDRLILPDTRHLMVSEVGDGTTLSSWTRRQGEWEELTIASVSGNVVILTTPLRFDHFGARNADNQLVLLPHVGNLSRNVIVRSANPIGTGVQGHMLFTSRAEVDIRYSAFRDLGRTKAIPCAADANNNQLSPACSNGIEPHVNQIGRYPIHFHHLIGPIATPADGHQFTFSGNAIDGGSAQHTRRWSVAIHASHYGLISENVAYNYAGALFNTEDGTESYNVIEKNLAVRSSGTGGRLGFGNEGMGFWFRGPNNYVRGNVAADFDSDNVEAAYGYKYFMHGQCPGCDSLANIKIPTAPGQDPSQYKTVSGNSLPILQFENNEVYSAAEGLTYWWLSSSDPIPSPNPKVSVFKDLRIWNVYNIGIYHYPGARVLFDGLQIYGDVFRADRPDFYACCGRGFHGEDYAATDIRIINSKIHNMWSPFIPSAAGTGRQIIENTELKNTMWSDVGVDTMFSANGPDWLPSRKIILNNVKFRGTEVASGGSGVTISKEWFLRATSNLFQADQLLVLGFQGSPTDNFEVFYADQAFSDVAGGLAPCQTTREGIQGLVCQTDASRGPVITWLDPWEGSSAGGTIVKISGANFQAGARVTFDGVAADVRTQQANSLEVRVPAHVPGSVAVKVENPGGLSDELPANYETETDPGVFIRVPIGFTFSGDITPPPPVNAAPIAVDDSYVTTEDAPLSVSGPGVLGNDSDADGNPLTAVLVNGTLNGTLTLNGDGSFTYTPNPLFSGADSFTYKANDGTADSNVATVTIAINAVNHPPVATDDSATIPEDALGIDVLVLANDSDADRDTLQVTNVTTPSRGVVTIGGEGRLLSYSPNRNACGIDTFDYTVSDGRGGADIGRVTINITCVNDVPQPVADTFTVPEDSVDFVLDVLANDITVDEGETLNVESCGLSSPTDNMHGTVRLSADRRTVLYTPARNFTGTATFSCIIGDGVFKGANAPGAPVTVIVTPVNDAPVAADQSVSTNEDTAKAITLSATDADSTTLTYTIVSIPAHGKVALNGAVATYTPDANFSGSDSFAFRANDGAADSNIATVSITVNPVNDAPIANAQSVSTGEDTPKPIVLVASDVDNAELTYTVSTPQHGTLSGTAPNVTYTPNADYFGSDSFTFTASDGSLSSAPATVSITIIAVNDAPVAANQAVTTNEDTAASITLGATDVDSEALTFAIVVGPSHGTATISGGTVIYTPALNFSGPDSFTFTANDGTVDSNVATVSVAVTAVDDAPVAASQSVSTDEDAAAAIVLGATDVEGSALSFTIVTSPEHGTLSGSAPNLTYTPAANYNGADSFTFTANDGATNSNLATVSIAINAVNDTPVAVADSYSVDEDQVLTVAAPGLLGNDSDVDAGTTLTAMIVGQPAHGTLVLNANGSFSYTPEPNFSGGDAFTYKANDGTVDSNVVTVTITVNAMNDAPVAQNATVSTDEDAPVSISLLATDEDGGSLTYAIVTGPQHGTVTIAGSIATYTPAANFSGSDSFTFKANDGSADSNVATVTIAINPVNDAPVAVADSYSTLEDQPLSVAAAGVLGNDTDVENDSLSAHVVSGVANGTLSLNLDGSFTYTPNAGFSGTDSFTYVARDGSLDSNAVAVTITVAAVNDAPVANDQSLVTNEDTSLSITLTASDGDSDAGSLTFAVLGQPQHGTLSVAGANVVYTPADNYFGSDSFTFKANDGSLDSNVATVSIAIAPVNDAPVAADDSYTADQNMPLAIAAPGVLGNDSDLDGPALAAAIESQPAHGTVALNEDGGFTYVPAAGFTGSDTFTYRATDGTLSSAPATVSIAVFADRVSQEADARAVVSTDNDGVPGATAQDPVETSVTLAGQAGAVSIGETAVTQPAVPGYTFFNYQVSITAPAASAADPLLITFTLDASIVPAGQNAATLAVFRSGVLVANCDASAGSSASPDPCVAARMLLDDGDVQLTIRTSAASDWNFAVSNDNAAPVASDDEYTTGEETPLTVPAPGVLGNDADADGNTLTASLLSGPASGTLTLNPDGSFSYTPNANFAGSDSFTYEANDGRERSNVATVTITVAGVNDAPSATDDSASTSEDVPVDIPVVANDVDPDGENSDLQVAAGSIANIRGGTAALLADGRTVRFTPAAGANDGNTTGGFGFTYRVADAGATSANEGVVTVSVSAVNDGPQASGDSYTTAEDTALEIAAPGVLDNDSDADGDSLSAVLASGPTHGTLTLNTNGSFRYEPAANYSGPDSFVYKASDGTLESEATVSITVTAVNDAPAGVADTYATDEDIVLNVAAPGVLGNDTDADSDNLTAALVAGPSHGALTLNADGSFSYTPAANYNGADSFTYQAKDATAASAAVTVSIAVNAVNDAPVAQDQSVATAEEQTLPITLGAADDDSTALEYAIVQGPAHGTLSGAAPNVVYTPAADYNGPDSFTFKANDGSADSNVATVTITVAAVNDAPVAAGDAFAAVEDQPLVITAPGVLGNDADVDGDALSAVSVSGPAHGVLALNADGSFTYTPAANFSGADGFTYRVSDGSLTSEPVAVSISVASANDAPVAMNDAYQVTEGGTLTVGAPGVLGNDTDIDGDLLTALLVTAPEHGSIELGIDGGFIYTPEAHFNGADLFTYSAVDAGGNSALATVQILVTAVNDAPVAAADAYSVAEDGQLDVDAERGVLSNDTDVEHDALKAMLVSQASHGMVTLNEDGSFSYVPALNFTGTDSFSYKANDGQADSDVVDVTITVDVVNDAPTATNDTYSVDEDGTLTIAAPGVLGNDSDTDGDALSSIVVGQPEHGSLTLNADGSFSYKPAANYNGPDAFSYKANDGNADSNVADVTITVRPVNDAPVAASQSVATAEDTPLAIALGASDVDGDALTYTVVSGPTHGTLSGSAPDLTYTPAADYSGPDAFTFTVNDGSADSNVATVSIAVGSANDAPAASNDSYTVVEDGTLAVDAPGVLANDSDADGNPLTAVLVDGPAHGTVALAPNGSFNYRPAANFTGADSFTYRANDGSLDSNTATVSITVTAAEDAPVANTDNYSVAEDATLTVPAPGVLGNDTDSDSMALTVALVGTTSNGTLTLNADGSFTYAAAADFTGSDSFTYRASDGANSSELATVTINVSAVNDPPVITAILNQGAVVGKVVSLQIVAQDVDSPTLRYSATGLPGGLVLDPATGRIDGTPTTAGTFTVTVTVSDGAASANAVFTWTVQPALSVIVKPSDQLSVEREHVQLQMQTTLPERKGRDRRVFAATGLPPGLKIDQDGVIDGRLKNRSAGVYEVTVTVTLGNTSGSAQFRWTVTNPSTNQGKNDPYESLDDRDDQHDNKGSGSGSEGR